DQPGSDDGQEGDQLALEASLLNVAELDMAERALDVTQVGLVQHRGSRGGGMPELRLAGLRTLANRAALSRLRSHRGCRGGQRLPWVRALSGLGLLRTPDVRGGFG